jgi:hypothetical protein
MRLVGGRDTCLSCDSSAPCSLAIPKTMAVSPSIELSLISLPKRVATAKTAQIIPACSE